MGGECIWLSKFHACCNAIEYVWGNRKKAHRKVCDFKMDTLRRTGFKTMLQADPTFVQKAFRKARNFARILRRVAQPAGAPLAAATLLRLWRQAKGKVQSLL